MAFPIRSKNPPESFPFATIFLVVANVLAYIVTTKDGIVARESVVMEWGVKAGAFSPLKLLTSMFLHSGLMHLLGNMWFLVLFGMAVEGRLRWYRFVPLYLLAGAFGGALHIYVLGRAQPDVPLIGASGAIMGIMGAALWMFPHAKVTVLSRWGERGDEGLGMLFRYSDWSMWVVGLYYLGFDLLFYMLIGKASGTAHLAHLGGALAGFLLCALCRPHRDSEMASQSKATLAEVKDLAVLSRLELAELHLGNPHDPLIVLHWMDKSLRDTQGPNQACLAAFEKAFPKMRREIDPRALAAPMLGLAHLGKVRARDLIALAGDLERAADTQNALRLYEVAYGMADVTDAEQETACFRAGLLYENTALNAERAAGCYAEVLNRWPMGSFAASAQSRLKGLQARARA